MTTPEFVDVGGRLRDIRQERGLSLRALSEVCGLSVNAISLIERGISSPSVSSLQRLAVALDVPITAFFTD
jgi:transcriptional regulator with XRE-family HTH domain